MKTSRSLFGAMLAACILAASAASATTVYVPTDQGAAQRSPLVSQTSDLPMHGLVSYTGEAKNAPTQKIDADKMAGRTPDKVTASRTPVALADANKLFGKTVDSRTPAMFQASAQGAKKHDVDVGGDQQVASVGSSPPVQGLEQVGSQYFAMIETGRVSILQPSTDVGARSPVVVIT